MLKGNGLSLRRVCSGVLATQEEPPGSRSKSSRPESAGRCVSLHPEMLLGRRKFDQGAASFTWRILLLRVTGGRPAGNRVSAIWESQNRLRAWVGLRETGLRFDFSFGATQDLLLALVLGDRSQWGSATAVQGRGRIGVF